MQIAACAVNALKPVHWEAWEEIQKTNPELSSPHFSAQFVRLVAEVRPSIEVAVLSENGRILGFLPFHRGKRGIGEPVAATFSELQGLVAPANLQFDPRELLRACRLSQLRFTDLLACQSAFTSFHAVEFGCPSLDLSHGFEAYFESRRAAGTQLLKRTVRKARNMEKEVGPLRFELRSRDPAVLETLLQWKLDQLQQRKLANPFAAGWPKRLVERLLELQSDEFGGLLSALYVGDQLAAAGMGFRSPTVMNNWLSAYSNAYCKYSPGLIFLMRLAEAVEPLGIQRMDMGRGDEEYKKSFASNYIPVIEGTVDRSRIAHALRNAKYQAREWVRTSPLGQPARQVVQRCRFVISQWRDSSKKGQQRLHGQQGL